VIVDWALLYIRRALEINSRGLHRALDPGLQPLEVLRRLPEVRHAPPAVDRSRGMQQRPLERVAVEVDVLVDLDEPLTAR
jgi:hypothetical protein